MHAGYKDQIHIIHLIHWSIYGSSQIPQVVSYLTGSEVP